MRALVRERSEPLRIELPQRPYGRAAHQRRGILEQTFGLRREPYVAGIADRDQHIAHKTVAADAFDGRLREQRAERRIVEPRKLRKLRRAQYLACRELRLAP